MTLDGKARPAIACLPEEMEPVNLNCQDDEDCKAMLLKNFGKNIRKIRLGNSLTQERVGEKAGMSPKYLGEVERGEKNPTALVVMKLSRALDAPTCELLLSGYRYGNAEVMKGIAALFKGRSVKEQRKAVKLLEVFFE